VDQLPALKKNDKHSIEVVVDRIKVRPDIQQRLAESFETAVRLADGKAMIVDMDTGKEMIFSSKFACPVCSYS
jgi:excinuclease ABC subunit A